MRHYVLPWSLLACLVVASPAQELLGAKEALRLIRERAQQASQNEGSNQPEDDAFERALKEYQQASGDLDATQRAIGWLGLYEVWLTRSDSGNQGHNDPFAFDHNNSTWMELLDVLPSPESWQELARQIQARELPTDVRQQIAARGLRLLAHRLNGNLDDLKVELDSLEQLVKSPAATSALTPAKQGILGRILQGFPRNAEPSTRSVVSDAIRGFRVELARSDPVEQFRLELSHVDENGSSVVVPNLVSLVGREQAAELIKQALQTNSVELQFDSAGPETLQLAREIALQNVSSLASPPWSLCLSTDTPQLFEALLDRFSEPSTLDAVQDSDTYSSDARYFQATAVYLRGLILRGQLDEAAELILKRHEMDSSQGIELLNFDENHDVDPRNLTKIFEFLIRLTGEHPELPLWNPLAAIGVSLGRADDVLKLVNQLAEQDNLPEPVRQSILPIRARVLLAAGKLEEAVDQYRQLYAAAESNSDSPEASRAFEFSRKIAIIGHLLERAEWIEEGLSSIDKLAAARGEQAFIKDYHASTWQMASNGETYVDLLVQRGDKVKAERLLIGLIALQQSGGSFYLWPEPELVLAKLYSDASRFDDVITLLDEATWWDQIDLADFLGSDDSLATIAAKAFAQTGRRDLARQIVERLVFEAPEEDQNWQLLLDLVGDEFPAIADRVFQRNQFEERPLIWLAQFQLNAGRAEEAEGTIRRAIAIDPSDGEQGAGDRMRAYSVLADVLAAQSNEQAAQFRQAVSAIRLSEKADRFLEAGMYSHAIKTYRQSLQLFADAYCIQSRLAIQLAAGGDFAGAAQHYEKAFELMPDSFGRVESHCFGCEGAFEGELASSIAERVFTRLVQQRPKDPKVYYLMGYLQSSKGRYDEALKHYRLATSLDPDYLNAWRKILELTSHITVPATVVDDAALNAYRLAPLQSGYYDGPESVSDLKRLWQTAAETNQRIATAPSGSLYRLRAAALAAEQSGSLSIDDSVKDVPTPNQLLSQNNSISWITQIMEAHRLDH